MESDKYGIKVNDNTFKRTPIKDEIRYRKIKRLTFEKDLQQVLPSDCELCFHGTPIWNTQKILQSGNISSMADKPSKDEDKIYVTTIEKVWFTIRHFADLGNYAYPAGCIFVLTPKDEEEIKSSREQNKINSVNFECECDRLKAIITTPENLKLVKQWVKQSGLNIDESIVVDYDEFLLWAKNYYTNQEVGV